MTFCTFNAHAVHWMYTTDSAQAYGIPLPDSIGGGMGIRIPSVITLAAEKVDPPEGAVPMVTDGAWLKIHVAPFGIWTGHPKGKIAFTRDAFDQIIANFARRSNPVKIDYEHDSLNPTMPGFQKLAAGWVHGFEVVGDGYGEGDGLYGIAELTERAADLVKRGEVKFNSPVINPKAKDRKTNKGIGLELIQVALTSDPFLDGQKCLTLTRIDPMAEPTQTTIPMVDPAPAPTALAEENAADMTAVLKQLAEMMGVDEPAAVAALMDKLEAVAKVLGAEAAEEGTPAEATAQPATVPAATPAAPAPVAATVPASTEPDPVLGLALSRLDSMSDEIQALKADKSARSDAAIAANVDELIQMNHVRIGDRDDAIMLFKTQPEIAERLYRSPISQVGVTQLTRDPGDGGEPQTVELTDVDEMTITNMVATGRYSRDSAIEKILNKRSN